MYKQINAELNQDIYKQPFTREGRWATSSVPYFATISAELPIWSSALTSTMLISSWRFLFPLSLCNYENHTIAIKIMTELVKTKFETK